MELKWFKLIIKLAVISFIILIAVGILLPKNYSISRSVTINSTSGIIHNYVGDLNQWDKWGPWQRENPKFKIYKGPVLSNVGAHESWISGDSGGELTFTKSDPDYGIEYELKFNNGKYKSLSSIRYDKSDNTTKVTWNMTGITDMPVLGGYFALLLDPIVGDMFQEGLNNLKQLVEHS